MPAIDQDMGLHQVAQHYYFPGWHQQATIGELLINLAKWNSLSEQHRKIIEVACGDSLNWSFVRSEALQFAAMENLRDKGVTIHRWPDQMLDEFEARWHEVVAEESARDPLFERIYGSFSSFRDHYDVWKEHGYLQ